MSVVSYCVCYVSYYQTKVLLCLFIIHNIRYIYALWGVECHAVWYQLVTTPLCWWFRDCNQKLASHQPPGGLKCIGLSVLADWCELSEKWPNTQPSTYFLQMDTINHHQNIHHLILHHMVHLDIRLHSKDEISYFEWRSYHT